MRETTHGLRAIRLHAFRNYGTLDLTLPPGLILLVGPNGQGKTNLLEAIYLLATSRVLRGMRDHEAILQSALHARVEGDLLDASTTITITLGRGERKKAFLNGLGLPRAADLLGRLPCVAISTADLAIVKDEPSDRRLFLDTELSQLSPGYLNHLAQFKHALEQRNALLKLAQERSVEPEQFDPWEETMAHHGAALRAQRRDYVLRLDAAARVAHASLSKGESLQVALVEKDDSHDESGLREAFRVARRQDIARGTTSLGPHRDDLAISVNEKEARLFGSQGQQRTAVLAIKLAGFEVLRERVGGPPLLLLDDILSDLDEFRRQQLVAWVLEHAGQAVLTCTEASAAGPEMLSSATVFAVNQGTLSKT